MITSGVIVFAVLILIFIFLLMLVGYKADSPVVAPVEKVAPINTEPVANDKITTGELPKNSSAPEIPEKLKIRYFAGLVKEVKASSIIITQVSGEEVEISFDSSTKVLIGQGMGEPATIADLASDWNVAVFLPSDKENNVAQKIQMISQK